MLKVLRARIFIVLAFVLLFDQVRSQFEFDWFAGDGDKKDGEKDKGKRPWYEFYGPNQDEKKRSEGKKRIRFALWNRKNKIWVEMNRNSTSKVPKSWIKNANLKVLIHSYSKETLKSPPVILTIQKIYRIGHAYGNYTNSTNIMIVDWTSLGVENESRYNFVVSNVPIVGEVVADYLSKLIKAKHLQNASDIHMVGYGMGAHVAGVAGKLLKNKKHGGKVGRITGLDPSNVGFDDDTGKKAKNKSRSLGKSDAEFVDVIHCSSGIAKTYSDAKWQGRYGSAVQAGHADFYPNGGSEQPGCKDDVDQMGDKVCSTKRCPEYFAKSIEGVQFLACECQDYDDYEEGDCECTLKNNGAIMGEKCSKTARGKYFLQIKGTEKTTKKKTDNDKHKVESENKKKISTTTTVAPEKKKKDKKKKSEDSDESS